MTTQSVNQTQWGLAAVSGNWPGTPGPWPSTYGYGATGLDVPVYIPDAPLALNVLGPRASMIHNPWGGMPNVDHGTLLASLIGSDTHGVAKGCLMLGSAASDNNGNGDLNDLLAAFDAILAHKQANYPNQKAVCVVTREQVGQNVANGLASRVLALKNAGVYVLAATGQASSGQGIDDLLSSGFNIWPAEDPNATPVTGCSLDGVRHQLYHCVNRADQIIAPALDNEYLNHLGAPTMGWGTTLATAFAGGVLACYIEAGFADPLGQMLADRVMGKASGFPADTGVLYKDPAMAAQVPAPPPPPTPSVSTGAAIGFEGTPAAMNFSGVAMVPFNKVIRGDWTQGAKLVVPAGFTEVKVGAMVLMSGVAVNSRVLFRIARNGVLDWAEGPRKDFNVGASAIADANLVSGWLPVSEGETFEVSLYCSDPSVTLSPVSTMWIEGR